MRNMIFSLVLSFFVMYVEAEINFNLTEGSECYLHGIRGKCVGAKSCPSFNLIDLRKRSLRVSDICSHNNIEVVVCCLDCEPYTRDYRDSAITGDGYLWKNGNKSWDQCVDFLGRKEYGCLKYRTVEQKKIWNVKKKCITTEGWRTANAWSYAFSNYRNSVAHIARLEYGEELISVQTDQTNSTESHYNETSSIETQSNETLSTETQSNETLSPESQSNETQSTKNKWLCGGSLISERFILTVAQCGHNTQMGPVTFVSLGVAGPDDSLENMQRYKVKRFVPHPEYQPPILYHDIALIETEKEILFNINIVPICLVYDSATKEHNGRLASWGSDEYRSSGNRGILVTRVNKFNSGRCSFHYSKDLPQGVNSTLQTCYKDQGREKSCQSAPGLPLEVENDVVCTRFLAALTSYNRSCGVHDGIGLYTRVLPYIPWIESVVWPENLL